jgi:hypothetical protein
MFAPIYSSLLTARFMPVRPENSYKLFARGLHDNERRTVCKMHDQERRELRKLKCQERSTV